jgi:hypothetical protein
VSAMLGDIIDYLKTQDPSKKVRHGLGKPHSYRGYYDQVAFEPVEDTTIGEMLKHAESAIGPTFIGYKGGEYSYDRWTDAWLAQWGRCGDALSVLLLKYMTGDEPGAK